jgi:hypothetical protein
VVPVEEQTFNNEMGSTETEEKRQTPEHLQQQGDEPLETNRGRLIV